MPGTRTPAGRRRPGQALSTALGVLFTVLIGIFVLLAFVLPGGRSSAGATASPSSGSTGSPNPSRSVELRDLRPSDTSTSASGTVPPALTVRLPASTTQRFGVPTGFGRSPEGATATAVSLLRTTATWDYDAADRAIQAYSRAADVSVQRTRMRTGISRSRSALKLPATGPVPATYRIEVIPVGVYWTVVNPTTVDVSILLRASSATTGRQGVAELRNAQYRMTWVEGDWRNSFLDPSQATRQPDAAAPGTPQFNTQGWKALIP